MSWHFTCHRLKTRHQTTVDMCLNRRRKPDLFPECRGCKIKLRQPVKFQYQDDTVEDDEEISISDYLKMIQKRAWVLLKPSPLNESHLSDLISEGMVSFYETLKDFDSTKENCFSTYFWRRLNHRLKVYITKNLKECTPENIECGDMEELDIEYNDMEEIDTNYDMKEYIKKTMTPYNQHDYMELIDVINGLPDCGKRMVLMALDDSCKPTIKNFSLATSLSQRKIIRIINRIRKDLRKVDKKQF